MACNSNNTEVRWAKVPLPLLPAAKRPGWALASCTRLSNPLIAESAGTTSTKGWEDTMPSASKSLATS